MESTCCFLNLLLFFCDIISIFGQENATITPTETTNTTIIPTQPSTPMSTTVHTIRTVEYNFNITEDAQEFHRAVAGLGTDEDTIIKLMTSREASDLAMISKEYFRLYSKNLSEDVADDLSGNFKVVVMNLFDSPSLFFAKEVHTALTSSKIDYYCLNQILPIRNRDYLEPILRQYKKYYNKTMLETVEEVLTGEMLEFYKELLKPPYRDPEFGLKESVDLHMKYIPDPQGTCVNKKRLMFVMATQSEEHLRHVCYKYELKHNSTIVEAALKKAFSEPLLSTYIAIIEYIKSPVQYYARIFHKALTGTSVDDKTLIRMVIGPLTINKDEIKILYHYFYKKNLENVVQEKTSGDYQKILVRLLGTPTDQLFKDRNKG